MQKIKSKTAAETFSQKLVPTNLYGFDVSWGQGMRRFMSACLHDPFVRSYNNTTTGYKTYLEGTLLKRQVMWVQEKNKKLEDENAVREIFTKQKGSLTPIEEKKIDMLIQLAYRGVNLASIDSAALSRILTHAVKEGSQIDRVKNFCETYARVLKTIKGGSITDEHAEKLMLNAYNKAQYPWDVDWGTTVNNLIIEPFKRSLTPEGRMEAMTQKMVDAAKGEVIFEGLLCVFEILFGEFGICGWHEDKNQVMAFMRLSAGIAFIIWTMPISMSFLDSLWKVRATWGTVEESKTWGEMFKKMLTDAQASWKAATNNINAYHPFVDAVLDTAIIMIPWAYMCYYGWAAAYTMYAYMDTILMIKSGLLAGESISNIAKAIPEYFLIGWLRGYLKFWLLPQNQPLVKMIAYDNLLTVLSVLTGKLMHILHPYGNTATPEGAR